MVIVESLSYETQQTLKMFAYFSIIVCTHVAVCTRCLYIQEIVNTEEYSLRKCFDKPRSTICVPLLKITVTFTMDSLLLNIEVVL